MQVQDFLNNPGKKQKIQNYLSGFAPSERESKLLELNNGLKKRSAKSEIKDRAEMEKKKEIQENGFASPKELPSGFTPKEKMKLSGISSFKSLFKRK